MEPQIVMIAPTNLHPATKLIAQIISTSARIQNVFSKLMFVMEKMIVGIIQMKGMNMLVDVHHSNALLEHGHARMSQNVVLTSLQSAMGNLIVQTELMKVLAAI